MENQTNNHVKIVKNRILLIALAVCCIAALATGTVAYFTAEETAYNAITMGQLEMELCETTADGQPWPENGVSGVMPARSNEKNQPVRPQPTCTSSTIIRISCLSQSARTRWSHSVGST